MKLHTRLILACGALLFLVNCQPSTLPAPTVVPDPVKEAPVLQATLTPTKTSIPTATLVPTFIPTRTMTPVPTEIPILCGTPVFSSAEIPALKTGKMYARFEPPDGKSYFGFTFKLWDLNPPSANAVWGDIRPFAERICDSVKNELAGKTPTIITIQVGWDEHFSVASSSITSVRAVLGPTVIPVLDWPSDPVTTSDIASGKHDQYIQQFAREVKEYGQPLFIRPICGGFNGGWNQSCSPNANPNLTVQNFVDAWHKVVDIFKQESVANVAWIWTPAGPPPLSRIAKFDPNWQKYYPGDDYVDWVGASMDTWGYPGWLEPVYQFGLKHDKPFFLATFGIRHPTTSLTPQQQVKWMKDMFDFFETHQRIKAILYMNYRLYPDKDLNSPGHIYLYDSQVSYVPGVNDFDQRLIAGGAEIRELYANRISNPRYTSTLVIHP